MERLTEEKQIGPFGSLKDKAEAVPGAFGTYDCFYAHMVAVTRLKQYEDTGLTPEEITALIAPNAPLTLEELREMDGEPVWCAFSEGRDCNMIIQWHNSEFFRSFECGFLLAEEYGKSWQAYLRKPEGT